MSPSTQFALRSARSSDALCLGALATQVFFDTYATSGIDAELANEAKEHYSQEVFARRLESPDVAIAVAEVGGKLAGFIDVQRNGNCPVPEIFGPEILRLYIQAPFQGQGLGQALLRHAEREAYHQGASAVWLTAWVGNIRAAAFYPRAGYKKVGSMEYVISGKGYENQVFAKRLPAQAA